MTSEQFGILGLALILAKIIDKLIDFVVKPKSKLTEEERRWLKTLYDAHSIKDSNGVPLWYMPRGVLEKITESLTKVTDTQLEMINIKKTLNKPKDKKYHDSVITPSYIIATIISSS